MFASPVVGVVYRCLPCLELGAAAIDKRIPRRVAFSEVARYAENPDVLERQRFKRIADVDVEISDPVDGVFDDLTVFFFGAMAWTDLVDSVEDELGDGFFSHTADIHHHVDLLHCLGAAMLDPTFGMFTPETCCTSKCVLVVVVVTADAPANGAPRLCRFGPRPLVRKFCGVLCREEFVDQVRFDVVPGS